MVQTFAPVIDRHEIAEGIFILNLRCAEIAHHAAPGQFVNIRCGEACLPLLRRPFSISRVDSDMMELMFNVVGQGTRMLASKRPGESLDVLGPLGVPFGLTGDFQTAVLVGGGLGVAPLPFLTGSLLKHKKNVVTFIGARSERQITEQHLSNVYISTDDGSRGFHGNVVDLANASLKEKSVPKPKIFGCGPTNMLKALSEFAQASGIECELSLEGDMACGMGLCQGCPVERADGKKKYALVCVEGPTFNCKDILLR